MHTTRHNAKRPRRGLTLIELLVVVFIILAVSAAIVPVIAPTAAGRRQREAARAVSTMLSSAKSRAIETGRLAGVWLQGVDGERGTVLTLSHCEVPPSFSGLTLNATVTIENRTFDHDGDMGTPDITRSFVTDMTAPFPTGMIREGDLIKLGYGSSVFSIFNGTYDTNFVVEERLLAAPTPMAPWRLEQVLTTAPRTISDGTYAFEIIRQPRKSAASSIELPPGTAIDLYFSGDDLRSLLPRSENGQYYYSGDDVALGETSGSGIVGHNEPVIILFAANGTPDSVFRLSVVDNTMDQFNHLSWGGTAFTRPLYLLVGKVEKIDGTADAMLDADDDLSSNLVDLDNYWVSINPGTGTISTDPVGTVDGATVWERVQDSRAFAIEKLGIGGR